MGTTKVTQDVRLTERQLEVLRLIANGNDAKEVGIALNITTRTVFYHKHQMKITLGVKRDAGLIQYAVANHIVSII
jgi:DNA-binding CsgD family transcriptional regulator